MEKLSKIIVEWSGKRFEIEVEGDYTYGDLKYVICKKTHLKPYLQRFVNLDMEALKKDPNLTLDQLNITNGFILIMTGISDKPMPSTSGTCRGAGTSFEEVKKPLQQINTQMEQQANIAAQPLILVRQPETTAQNPLLIVRKPETAAKKYELIVRKPEIIIRPRQGKNLLVLDIDQTIFDCNNMEISGYRAVRPYLHQFLTNAYQDYDIIIWSATHMNVLMKKVELLGLGNNHNYKIVAYMDYKPMVKASISGVYDTQVKGLQAIWSKYEEYNHKNTVMCDDQTKNFYLNKSNGVLVEQYYYENYESDKELVYLSRYLKHISKFSDMSQIDHTNWKQCIEVTK